MSALTIICPNAKRVQVKTTPMMLIRQVLEEACLKSGFEVSSHTLRTQNNRKPIDLSLPFRLSGVSNNATLEMIEKVGNPSGSVVELAIQIPSGARCQKSVKSNTPLLEILQEFSSDFGEDLAAEKNNVVPCIVYMNKRYLGRDELTSNSLESLGVTSGKCLMRYSKAELTAADIEQIRAKQALAKEQKRLADEKFQLMKLDNEERARIEKQRQEAFDREMAEREEREKTEREEIRRCQHPNDQAEDEAMDTAEQVVPRSRDILQDMPEQRPDDWSFDRHHFTRPGAHNNSMRLEELNQLLERVNSRDSRDDGRVDAMVNALADGGRISLSQVRQRAEAESVEENKVEVEVFAEPCDRQAVLFQKIIPKSDDEEKIEVSDEFFEVKVEDVKAMQRDLRKVVREQTQGGFMSKTFLANKNRSLKMAAYKHCVIRIHIGEQVLQLCFRSGEKSKNLETYLKSIIVNEKARDNLKMFFTNQKVLVDESKNFVDLEIAPKANLVARFGIDNVVAQQLLSPQVRYVSPQEADDISKIWLLSNTPFVPFNTTIEQERTNKRESTKAGTSISPPAKAALPKWMMNSKK